MSRQRQTISFKGEPLTVIRDGRITEDYDTAVVRVVHVLREPTESTGLGSKLLAAVRDDGTMRGRIWSVTARRSYCLQHGAPLWGSLDKHRLGDAFRASAVINMNDTIPEGGGSRTTTNLKQLKEIALERWQNRKAKLLELSPSVVVCGGTYPLVRQLLGNDVARPDQMDDLFLWQGIPFVYAWHPSFRGRKHADEYGAFRKRCRRALALMPGKA